MPFDPSSAKPMRFDPTSAHPAETDFDAGTMVKNIPGSAAKFARDMVTPILHPVQASQALWNLTRGLAQKGIPGEQTQEAYVDQVGAYIKDRYGSLDALKQSVMSDPVGVLADYSAALMTAGSAAAALPGRVGKAGRVVQQAGAAADPVNIAANTGKQAARAVPKAATRSMYDSAVKWRTTIDPKQRQRMTDTALKEGLPPSYKGVGRMHAKIRELGEQLDTLIDSADGKIPADAVLRHLDDAKKKLGGFKSTAPADIAVIDDMRQSFVDYLNDQGITDVTPRQLQEFKTNEYKRINFDMSQGGANYARNEGRKAMARAAKESIEGAAPGVEEINKKLGDLLEIQPELERAAGRVENKNTIGISEPIMVTAGAGIGQGAGAATAGAVTGGIMAAVKRKSAEIAVYIEKVRQQGVPESYIQNSLLPAMLREASVELGRLVQQPVDEEVNEQPNRTRGQKRHANALSQPKR